MNTFSKAAVFCAFISTTLLASPVDRIGALSVQNGTVVGANGQPANLRGMSFFWNIAPEARDYYNADVVNWLADDWNATLIRAAMAVEDNWGTGQEGYEYQPDRNKKMVTTLVDAAVAKGIYVIIDWHSHWSADNSNPQRLEKAKSFFTEMATTYGHLPNVIYEIYNEPGFGRGDWAKVKTYNDAVVSTIRSIDSDNLIIVGTPQYSSAVDVATADPLSAGYGNIAYSFHMYASDPAHDTYKDQANTALSKGYALFVSEWGVSQASGNGALDYTRIDDWLNWMTEKHLSWAAWSISNKNESSSALKSTASVTGNWSAGDLSDAGTWYRNTLRSLNPAWDAPAANVQMTFQNANVLLVPKPHGLLVKAKGDYQLNLYNILGNKLVSHLDFSDEVELDRLPQGLFIVDLASAEGRSRFKVNVP